jgi:hypothetical protein
MVRNDSGTTATTTNDDDGAGAWDLSLTAGRTGGGRSESSDPSSRAELAERRLMETQQVLVQERAKREVAEAILAETAKALSAVRRAAADGGAASTSGVALRGGGEEAAAVLNEKLTLLRNDYDALKREFELKDREHAKMSREINRLEDGLDLTETGRPSHDRPRDQADEHIRPGRTRHVLKAALRPRERAGTIAVGVSRSRRTTSEDHRGRGVHPGAAATGAKG